MPDKGFKAYVRVAKGNLPISIDLKRKGRYKSMTNAEKKHLEEIERVKKAMRETNSYFLYKDYKKYLKRLMKELKQYRDYRNAKMM